MRYIPVRESLYYGANIFDRSGCGKDIKQDLHSEHLLNIPKYNTATYSMNSVKYNRTKIWNLLPK